jgi:hypothetical protein
VLFVVYYDVGRRHGWQTSLLHVPSQMLLLALLSLLDVVRLHRETFLSLAAFQKTYSCEVQRSGDGEGAGLEVHEVEYNNRFVL